MSSISAISSTLIKRTLPLCSCKTPIHPSTRISILSLKNPSCSATLVHARLQDSPDQYPTRRPPEFSPAAPDFDKPSIPTEIPGIPTYPEIEPEVNPYPPPPDPGPSFPVPPLTPPPVPDVPLPFPGNPNPFPGPDILPPKPPEIVPPRPPGTEIIYTTTGATAITHRLVV